MAEILSGVILKRLFDIAVSFLVFLLLWPLMVVVALLIFFKLGRPVLFQQRRPGLHGQPFYIYKFRTLSLARDNRGELLSDHERMTPLGTFLRKYSLDELPQLYNVIKGDLSLVGPRPLLMEYLSLYSPEQMRRQDVCPGITGWAQVNGRNAISWEEKFMLDVWYVDHQSLWLDIKIILLTIKKVFIREGISAKGEATMPKFTGSKGQ